MNDEPEMIIPLDRLPAGFAERVGYADMPASEPKPAATAVLVRDSDRGPEILLLKRNRAAGFVPGAYVFPGGRVDEEDALPQLCALLDPPPPAPDAAYWLAAVREVFEETGALLATVQPTPAQRAEWRERLLTHSATLLDVMTALDARPDLSNMAYCAHWITPTAEPKRYDTRFFLAALPEGAEVSPDAREMSDATWLTAEIALARFREGRLPMIFPTVKTVQRLRHYRNVAEMLAAFRTTEILPVLPRLVRTEDGVGIVVDKG